MVVEAALVLPVMALLAFGIIEFGVAFKNEGLATTSTRAAARAFSSEPKLGDEGITTPSGSACEIPANGTAATAGVAMRSACLAATDAMRGLVSATPMELFIYRADPATGGVFGGSGPPTDANCPASSCVRYTWSGSAEAGFFQLAGGNWPARSRNACFRSSDTVGVLVRVDNQFFTRFVGTRLTLTEQTSMNLEPRPIGECAPT